MGLRAWSGLLRDTLLRLRGGGKDSDAEVLGRFVARQDQAAFAELVRRHGGMVLQVCQRVLGHVQDAEDAYQATFIILARKAASVSPPEAVGAWLHGVAYRTALNARKLRGKRRQVQPGEGADPVARERDEGSELREMLDAELERLPTKYRVLLVLCALEGRSLEEVARKLGRPVGTVKWELFQARGLLRDRLVRRGLSYAPAALMAVLAPSTAMASRVPPHLEMAVIDGTFRGYSAGATGLADATLPSLVGWKWGAIAALMLTGVFSAGLVAVAVTSYTTQSSRQAVQGLVAQSTTQRGLVKAVDATKGTITLLIGDPKKDGKDITWPVDAKATITIHNKPAKLADIKPGHLAIIELAGEEPKVIKLQLLVTS